MPVPDRRNGDAHQDWRIHGNGAYLPDFDELTDLQLQILAALWHRGEATVSELHESVGRQVRVSRKTVATLLSRLERRGIVRHRLRGRDGVYRAVAGRRRVLLARLSAMLGALFGEVGATPGAAAVQGGEVRPGDVGRLLALLRAAERDIRDNA